MKVAGAAVLGLVVAATVCALAAAPALGQQDVRGAGATFPFPLYAAWAEQYRRETGIEIVYDPVGSSAGVERLMQGAVDFAGSDLPFSESDMRRADVLQFPAVIGGLVPVLNLGGVKPGGLKLTGEVLADIYLGHIRKWNEPAIARLNPDIDLPNEYITVVHRADASGSTALWSDFLSRSSAEWKDKVGRGVLLTWPVGVGEAGNEGVASSVQRTRASIGYVEYTYAERHGLSPASLRNRDGEFVLPGLDSFNAAMAAGEVSGIPAGDAAPASAIASSGKGSWPITAASFIVLRRHPVDPAKTRGAMRFLDWAWRRGSATATGLAYVPVAPSIVGRTEERWSREITAPPGQPIWPGPAGVAPP